MSRRGKSEEAASREPLLSQGEVDSLLSALLPPTAPASEPARGSVVRQHDFAAAGRLSPERVKQLQGHCQDLAQELSGELTRYLGHEVEVEFRTLEQSPAEAVVAELAAVPAGGEPGGTEEVAFLVTWEARDAFSLWSLPADLAATLLEAMTGGQPGRVFPLSGRLSRLQSAWLQRLATVFLTALERVRQGLELPTPQGTRVETPRRLRPPVPEALLAVAAFEVRLWGTTQPLHLALPGAALQPLATVQPRAQPEQSDPGTVRAVRRNAGRAAIPLSVQLRSVTVPLQAVMSLAPGDTVCLQRSAAEPLLLLVGGRVKWLALAGTSRGRQAVRLVAVAPPTVS